MLEAIDDQMMIEALEDFEVSIFLQTSWFFKKTVSLTPICLITENRSREDERSGEEEGRERSGWICKYELVKLMFVQKVWSLIRCF